MAETRSVSVRLRAEVSGYLAGMAAAKKATTDWTKTLDDNEKRKRALLDVGNAAGAIGLAAAAGIGIAVKAAADFDKAMSGVEAATHASQGSVEQLRQAALKAGADTVFSATEAADGIEQLAKAGVGVRDILGGGLRGALDLAAAGELEVGDAAETAATAMTQFHLQGRELPHVADLLAAAAGKAQGDVSDMAMALKQGGLVANQTGLSIEETTGALAAFASQGLIGSDAGTSFKTMLQSLTPSSESASKAVQALGISAYDQRGQFIGLEEWAGRLRKGLSDMSDEQRNATLKTVFGSDAVRAATVIYDQGASGIQRWIANVNDQGYAAETAAIKLDNLSGDLEALKGSLETALIGVGEGAQSPLRGLVQDATSAVNVFNKLPGPLQASVFQLGALTAIVGGGIFVGTRVVAGISDMRAAVGNLGLSAGKTTTAMRALGAAGAGLVLLTVGVGAIRSLQEATDDALPGVNILTERITHLGQGDTVRALGGQFSDLGESLARITDKSTGEKITDVLQTPFEGLFGEAGSLRQARADIAGVDEAFAQLATLKGPKVAEREFRSLTHVYGLNREEAKKLRGEMPLFADALAGIRLQSSKTKGVGDDLAFLLGGPLSSAITGSTGDMRRGADATETYADQVHELDQRLKDLNAALENRSAWRGYRTAVLDARQALKENGATLDQHTRKGLANAEQLDAIAASALEVANQIHGVDKRQEFLDRSRRVYVNMARDLGATAGEARKLANSIFGIPEKHTTKPEFDKDQADRDRREYEKGIDQIPRDPKTKPKFDDGQARGDVNSFVDFFAGALGGIKDEDVKINVKSSILKLAAVGQGPIQERWAGGPITGPGTGTSDSIPALLSTGEHVLTADEVRKAGGHEVIYWLRQLIRDGSFKKRGDIGMRYADGGPVVSMPLHQQGLERAIAIAQAQAASVADALGESLSRRITQLWQFGGGRPLGPGGSLSRGQIMQGQQFAQAQDGKPYIWGGVGPGGYDCSGFQSAVINASLGRNPYSRIGSTSTMPWPGFKSGPGMYTIGWFTGAPGHTSGNIGGLGVESTDGSVRVGGAARSPTSSMFNHVAHYDQGGPLKPGWTAAYNGTGDDEYVVKPVQRFQGGGFVGGATPITSGYLGQQLAIPTALPTLEAYHRATKALNQAIREQTRERRQLTQQNKQAREASHALAQAERELGKYDSARDIRRQLRDLDKQEDAARRVLQREKATKAEQKDARAELEKVERQRDRLSEKEGKVVRLLERRSRLAERDRRQTKQAEQAEKDLTKAKDDHANAQRRLETAVSNYASAQQEAIDAARQTAEGIQATGAVFDAGFASTGSVQSHIDHAIANAQAFDQILRDLKARKAHPWLLQQFVAEGPTDAALRLGRQYLSSPDALAEINRDATRLVQISQRTGALAADPRFLSSARWTPSGALGGGDARTVQVTLGADPSSWLNEVKRVVRHEVRAELDAGRV